MNLGLISVFLKDMRLFFRDRKNLVLVVLTPVVIMFILGSLADSQSSEQYLESVKLGYCNNDDSFTLPYDFSLVSPEEQCELETWKMVEQGELRGALFIPEDFSKDIREGSGSMLTLLLDNSKGQVAFSIRTAMESMVNELNEDIAVEFVGAAWIALDELNTKLKYVVKHLSFSRGVVLAIQERALALNESLAGIEPIPGTDALSRVNVTLDELVDELKQASQVIGIAENVSFLQDKLTNVTDDILSRTEELEPLEEQLQELYSVYDTFCLNCTNCTFDLGECEALNESISQIDAAIARYESTREDVLDYSTLLENASTLVEDKYTNLSLAINDTIGTLSSRNLTPSQDDLSFVNLILGEVNDIQERLKGEIIEIDTIVVNLTEQILTLEEDLNATTVLLDEYTEKDPANIVRAVTLDSVESYPDKPMLEFLAPNMMLVVLLFLTLLISSMAIVGERRSMTMFRTLLSPLPLVLNLFQKLLFIVVLCAVQLALMFGVVFVLGVRYTFDWYLIPALLLISFLFSSLGFLIGAFSKSENSALLTSLVLAIPMMFLSGLLFPLDGMSGVMFKIAYWSPLTLGLTSLERLLIYGTGLQIELVAVKAAVALTAFLLSTYILARSPSLD